MAAPPMTPQRNLPGAYLNTPAPGRQQRPPPPAQLNFRPNAPPAQQAPQQAAAPVQLSAPVLAGVAQAAHDQSLTPVERAARNINDTLTSEALYPELDNYIGRECIHSYMARYEQR